MNKDRIMELSSSITVKKEATKTSLKEIIRDCQEYLRNTEKREKKLNVEQSKEYIVKFLNEKVKEVQVAEYVDREGKMNTQQLTEDVIKGVLHYGALDDIMHDETIDEIRNNSKTILIERGGKVEPLRNKDGSVFQWESPEEQQVVMTKMAAGEIFSGKYRLVNARTLEGFRMAIVDKSAMSKCYKGDIDKYCSFVLRKFKSTPITLEQMINKYHTLSDNMGKMLKMIVNSQSYVCCGGTNSGKSVVKNTKIITPTGYKLAKDIKVGDTVYDGNGEMTKIVGVYPQGRLEVYRITFKDGTYVEVSLDHINRVYEGKTEQKDMLTSELIEYYKKNKEYNHWIKRPMNIEHKQQEYTKIECISKEGYEEECVCFMVASSDHTYLVNDFIPTHNTTLNRALLDFIDNDLRVILCQEPTEIDIRKFDENGVQINDVLEIEADSNQQNDSDTTYKSSMENVLTHCLRLSPSLVSINEVRFPKEIYNLIQIALAGHITNTSFHGENERTALVRMTNLYSTESGEKFDVALMTVSSTVNFLVIQKKFRDGTRKVISVSEVIGCDGSNPIYNQIYKFELSGKVERDENGKLKKIYGEHKKVGMLSDIAKQRMMETGYTKEEIEAVDTPVDGKTKETYTGEGLRKNEK